ncbi:MAG: carboxymuconolactone decarboxylase family protein [Acidimicrobiia bacterium]|nr:carboxymuconolactone decarboxylase family protein [Acidimicrobiia bacterium]
MAGQTGSRSRDERHASAIEVLATMLAVDAERAERIASSMERSMGALGSMAIDNVMGDLWSRPQLSRRDRSVVVISVLMAQSRDEELALHVRNGLNHGLAQVEIEELLLHLAAYVGFPAAMAASRVVDRALCDALGVERITGRQPAARKSDAERDRDAADVRRTLTAGRAAADPAEDLANMQSSLGDVGTLAFRWAFGEIWSRPQLSRRDRSLCVIAILGALGQEAELAFHAPAGLNHGLERSEVEEVMVQLALYAGFPRAVDGMRAVRAAWAKIDRRAG